MNQLIPDLGDIRQIFGEKVTGLGGRVTEEATDRDLLILRSVLSTRSETSPGDVFNGGVALLANASRVYVSTYVFREVCRNGAIASRTTGYRDIERIPEGSPESVAREKAFEISAAIEQAAKESTFLRYVKDLRDIQSVAFDHVLMLMHLQRHLGLRAHSQALMRSILSGFRAEGDPSLYGMMNAITARARDESDPLLKWTLEDLGGRIPRLAGLTRLPPSAAVAGESAESEELATI